MFVTFVRNPPADRLRGPINQHILTDAQIDALVASGDAKLFPRPARTFVCASVPARLYDMATPLVP